MWGGVDWHYSDYCWPKHCPGGEPDGHCPLPTGDRFGACITGTHTNRPALIIIILAKMLLGALLERLQFLSVVGLWQDGRTPTLASTAPEKMAVGVL